ncbi:MAG: hypothetical protein IPM51_10135 [Sphingobacteriaceae bacterium]|nr:hypothetical protein [Sphingobacteriaceae bacterium]
MKNITLIFSLLTLFYSATAALETTADTAIIRILAMENDSNKVNSFYTVGRHSGNSDLQKTVFCFTKAIEISEKIKFYKGYRKSSFALVNFLSNNEMFEAASDYGIKGFDFFTKYKNTPDKSEMAGLLGNLFAHTGKYPLSLLYLTIKGNYDLETNNFKSYGIILQQKGRVYYDKQQYDSSLINTIWAAEIFKRNNMGVEHGNSLLGLAKIYIKKNKIENAQNKISEASSIFNANTNLTGLMHAHMLQAEIFDLNQKPDSAEIFLNKALLLADSTNAIHAKVEIYKSLIQFNELKKDYKVSFEYQSQYEKYRDEIINNAQKAQNTELLIKVYLLENKIIEKEKELDYAYKQKVFIILLLIIIGFLLVNYYKTKTIKS